MARTAHVAAALATVFVLVFLGTSQPRAQDGGGVAFVSGIEDLPLMAGLVEAPDDALVFDSPVGRIVEAYASGDVTVGAVLDFYGAALPQLGWRSLERGRFRREDEILRLEFPQADSGERKTDLVVRFALRPAGPGTQGK